MAMTMPTNFTDVLCFPFQISLHWNVIGWLLVAIDIIKLVILLQNLIATCVYPWYEINILGQECQDSLKLEEEPSTVASRKVEQRQLVLGWREETPARFQLADMSASIYPRWLSCPAKDISTSTLYRRRAYVYMHYVYNINFVYIISHFFWIPPHVEYYTS